MDIAICHRRKFEQVWGSPPLPPTRSHRKTTRPEGTPLDLRLPHGKIVVILRCNPWAVYKAGHRKVCLGVLYGQNEPKFGNLANLTPRSSANITSYRKVDAILETPNSTSLQCIPWLLWVKCLFDRLSISDFGGKWPLKWNFFENFFPDSSTGHRSTFCCQTWWKSAVANFPKGPLDYHTNKTRALRNSSQPPFCHKWADRPQNFLNVVTINLSTYTKFGPDRQRFAGRIPQRLLFRPKKSIQYRLSAYNDERDMSGPVPGASPRGGGALEGQAPSYWRCPPPQMKNLL